MATGSCMWSLLVCVPAKYNLQHTISHECGRLSSLLHETMQLCISFRQHQPNSVTRAGYMTCDLLHDLNELLAQWCTLVYASETNTKDPAHQACIMQKTAKLHVISVTSGEYADGMCHTWQGRLRLTRSLCWLSLWLVSCPIFVFCSASAAKRFRCCAWKAAASCPLLRVSFSKEVWVLFVLFLCCSRRHCNLLTSSSHSSITLKSSCNTVTMVQLGAGSTSCVHI